MTSNAILASNESRQQSHHRQRRQRNQSKLKRRTDNAIATTKRDDDIMVDRKKLRNSFVEEELFENRDNATIGYSNHREIDDEKIEKFSTEENCKDEDNDDDANNYGDEERFHHCSKCHDRYQFGNRSSKKTPYDGLKLGIVRYDELFAIATFYTRNGFLTVSHVNELMSFLEEDYPEAEWNVSKVQSSNETSPKLEKAARIPTSSSKPSSSRSLSSTSTFSVEPTFSSTLSPLENKDRRDNADSSLLDQRFKLFYRYECLLRRRKIVACKSYVTCLALFSKLRQIDKRHLVNDCSFYTNLFSEDRDVLRYHVTEKSDFDEDTLGDIRWDWRPVEYPVKFPHGPLLVSYHDKFDIPFYIATFYENYKYLTIQHLEFIFNSTIESMKTSRFHIARALSKIRFDVNCSDAIHHVSRLEKYLEDFIIRADRSIYHLLLNNNILRIWEFIGIDKFVHYYMNFFDENIRSNNDEDRFRNDYRVRGYVLSRIVAYRLSQNKTLHYREVCKIKDFFHAWLNDHLYQMAFPCSFFVNRKDIWESLTRLASTGVSNQEIHYLDCMTALRNLPSITCSWIRRRNSAECTITIDPPSHSHRSTTCTAVTSFVTVAESNNGTTTSFAVDEKIAKSYARSDIQKHSHKKTDAEGAIEITIDRDDYPSPVKNTQFIAINEERYKLISRTLANLNAFFEFDRKYRLKNADVLKFWDIVDINWIRVDETTIPKNLANDTRDIFYKVINDSIELFLDTYELSLSNKVVFYINHREIHFSGNFKSLHFTNWQEYGFDNPTPFFRNHSDYVQEYFYTDVTRLMRLCSFK